MRAELADRLRCPACRGEAGFDVDGRSSDEREVREGVLACRACGATRPISGGIADLLEDPPDFVRREAAGLARFAEEMRNEGWDEGRILNLPYEQHGYWHNQASAMNQVLNRGMLSHDPGALVLDIGSNTCWASAMMAREGLIPVALDISADALQGLGVGDVWFQGGGVYFDRVLGSMFDLPFAADTFDAVWCCEVLHHNHRRNLFATFREIHRVLKPGGRIAVVNEPVRALRSPKLRPGREVADYEGHEHAYLRRTYLRAARSAGLVVEPFAPWIHRMFCLEDFVLTPEMSIREGFATAVTHAVRRWGTLRHAVLVWQNYVAGTAMFLNGRKPG